MRAAVKIFQYAGANQRVLSQAMLKPPFFLHGSVPPRSPIVVSVPHAGRDYPDIAAMLRIPVDRLGALEDRYADLLAENAIRDGATALIANTPRLWIDFNRAETDLDPGMMLGGHGGGIPQSDKVRGGLGLIPRRLGALGDIWNAPLTPHDALTRIATHHRLYHAALAKALAACRARFGAAVLIDLHSMPSLPGFGAADIVLGDRFGTSADSRLVAVARDALIASGLRTAINAPYAGGHILTRHGRPGEGIFALQVEVDRRLYLDAGHVAPGPGLARLQSVIARVAAALADAIAPAAAIAAE